MGPLGIFLVGVPADGILGDILADAAKREFVADDVFVIVALPDGGAWGAPQFIDPACGKGFELADDFRQAVRRSGRGVGAGSEPAPTGPEPAAEPEPVVGPEPAAVIVVGAGSEPAPTTPAPTDPVPTPPARSVIIIMPCT